MIHPDTDIGHYGPLLACLAL